MADERAFAVQAPPELVWRLLRAEAQQGVESGRAQILHQEAPRRMVLLVQMGWRLRVEYEYAIAVKPEHTEVSCRVRPHGLRHRMANLVSFGRGTSAYQLALTQGLANLKDEAEKAVAAGRS